MLNDDVLREYVTRFKDAMLILKSKGAFDSDCVFNDFPRGCCGDTCDLLAKCLLSKGIDTVCVSGDFDGKSHAWLVVKDHRITPPVKTTVKVPVNQEWGYALFECNDESWETFSVDTIVYTEKNLIRGLIIDITADQFGESQVYVGYMNNFYKRFKFVSARDYEGLRSGRLVRIIDDIENMID